MTSCLLPNLSQSPSPTIDVQAARSYVSDAETTCLNYAQTFCDRKVGIKHVLLTGESALTLSLALWLRSIGCLAALYEEDAHSVERSRHFLKRLDAEFNPETDEAITFILQSDPLPDIDIVIDCGVDEIEKRLRRVTDLLDQMQQRVDVVFNTTDPEALFALSGDMPLFAMNCASPAHRKRLAEFASPPHRGLLKLFLNNGKLPLIVKSSRGLVSGRLAMRFYEEIEECLLKGAIPHELDGAFVEFGFKMGPLEMQDLSGLDGPFYERKRGASYGRSRIERSWVADRMCEEGRLGKKVGVGWYRYPGGEGAVIDPLLEDLIAEEAHFAGIKREDMSGEQALDIVLSALSREIFDIAQEGVVTNPAFVDLVAVHAIGFPAEQGSLLFQQDYKDSLRPA